MSEDRTQDAVPFAARHGVVRPLQGRYVAGVCAALGRATRTDPVLWRVSLAVLVCFGGVGALIYLLVWLASPEEGDTASPAEALVGKGQSNTSPVLTVVLGVIAAGLLVYILPRPLYVVLGGAVVLGALLLINKVRADPASATGAPPASPTAPAGAPPPPAGTTVPAEAPVPAGTTVPADTTVPAEAASPADPTDPTALGDPTAPVDATPPVGAPAAAGPLPGAATPPFPSVSLTPESPAPPPPGAAATGYRPPFAPHGPFGGPPSPPAGPRRPPRERSALPAIVFFSSLLALGILGVLDLAGAVGVPASGYIAGALAVIGTGLVVGTWLGRGRSLIALGAVLALALPVAHVAEVWDRPEYVANEFQWRPTSTADLQEEYELMLGSGELNLTDVDFTGQQVEVVVDVSFGEMQIIVPPDVAVEAEVSSRFSSTKVFGEASDGITDDTIRHPGSGDPADGTLRLDLRNRFGNVEVLGR